MQIDFNFKHWRPMVFPVDVEVGAARGNEGKNQVPLNDFPFVVTRITHQIIPPDAGPTPPNPGSVQEYQDGLYRIDWSIYDRDRFWSGSPPMADTAFGSIRHGIWKDLAVPRLLEGNQTLHVRVLNEWTRPDPLVVHIQFEGSEFLGNVEELKQMFEMKND